MATNSELLRCVQIPSSTCTCKNTFLKFLGTLPRMYDKLDQQTQRENSSLSPNCQQNLEGLHVQMAKL